MLNNRKNLEITLKNILKNENNIRDFKQKMKQKTLELLEEYGYEDKEKIIEYSVSELAQQELDLVSGGVDDKFMYFKRATALALTGITLVGSSDLYKSFATKNDKNNLVQTKENKNESSINNIAQWLIAGTVGFGMGAVGMHYVGEKLLSSSSKSSDIDIQNVYERAIAGAQLQETKDFIKEIHNYVVKYENNTEISPEITEENYDKQPEWELFKKFNEFNGKIINHEWRDELYQTEENLKNDFLEHFKKLPKQYSWKARIYWCFVYFVDNSSCDNGVSIEFYSANSYIDAVCNKFISSMNYNSAEYIKFKNSYMEIYKPICEKCDNSKRTEEIDKNLVKNIEKFFNDYFDTCDEITDYVKKLKSGEIKYWMCRFLYVGRTKGNKREWNVVKNFENFWNFVLTLCEKDKMKNKVVQRNWIVDWERDTGIDPRQNDDYKEDDKIEEIEIKVE